MTSSIVTFEIRVLVLDRDDVVVPGSPYSAATKRGQSTSPRPGSRGTSQPMPDEKVPLLYEPVAVDPHILGVHVEMRRAEVVDRALDVDHLPDQVRRVEVETEVLIGDRREHLVARSPASTRDCCLRATRRTKKIIGQFSIAIFTPRSPA